MTTKPISHFSLLGPSAYSTSVLMGNRAFVRMWAARRAAKAAGHVDRAYETAPARHSPQLHAALGR